MREGMVFQSTFLDELSLAVQGKQLMDTLKELMDHEDLDLYSPYLFTG
jgi:hypothetical protein